MAAFTFLCSAGTERECLDRLLFGTNPGPVYPEPLSHVRVGDYLFLWNYDTGILRGPFLALTPCTANIEPEAWRHVPGHTRGFPFQVRVDARLAYRQPLSADDLRGPGLLHITNLGLMPDVELQGEHLRSILEKFRSRNGEISPPVLVDGLPVVPGTEDMIAATFIFRCDVVTGGRCFAENVMGAPMPLFRDVVSTVQPGARVLLWHINDRKLYGIWKARTRGQYDPTAFPEAAGRGFHAVVHCVYEYNLHNGIEETAVREVIAYDGQFPPYRTSPADAEKLTEALFAANGAGEATTPAGGLEPIILADDGHRVRSQPEMIIDNMLFTRGHLHASERRVQVGDMCIRCDFYLPQNEQYTEIYVEYWGRPDQPQYMARRREKLAIYSRANIEPLELFPKVLLVLPEVWPAKLSRYERRRK